jgi:hypothetical protein
MWETCAFEVDGESHVEVPRDRATANPDQRLRERYRRNRPVCAKHPIRTPKFQRIRASCSDGRSALALVSRAFAA